MMQTLNISTPIEIKLAPKQLRLLEVIYRLIFQRFQPMPSYEWIHRKMEKKKEWVHRKCEDINRRK